MLGKSWMRGENSNGSGGSARHCLLVCRFTTLCWMAERKPTGCSRRWWHERADRSDGDVAAIVLPGDHGRAIRGSDAARGKGRLEPPPSAAPPVRERGGGARPEAHRALADRVRAARGQNAQLAR